MGRASKRRHVWIGALVVVLGCTGEDRRTGPAESGWVAEADGAEELDGTDAAAETVDSEESYHCGEGPIPPRCDASRLVRRCRPVRRANRAPDYRRRTMWEHTYDEDGNRIRSETDLSGDGDVDRVVTRSFDAEGRLVRLERDFRREEDPANDSVHTWDFDAGPGVRRRSVHYPDDPDEVEFNTTVKTYRYGADCLIRRRATDKRNDGETDWIRGWEYDDGKPTRSVWVPGPGNGGEPGQTRRWEYDEAGHFVRYTETGVDGTAVERWTYDGGANRMQVETIYPDGPSFEAAWVYDDNCNKVRVEKKGYLDDVGGEEWVTTISFDERGNKVREVVDADADGEPDETHRFVYDEQGNRIRTERDRDMDGHPERVTNVEYECR